MKKDLERWSDKLTPEEERRIWSKMRGALRGSESVDGAGTRSWLLRPWVTSAAVAAAAVVVVLAVWRTHEPKLDLAQVSAPDRAVEVVTPGDREQPATSVTETPFEAADRKMKGEMLAEPLEVSTVTPSMTDETRDKDIAEGQAAVAESEGDEAAEGAPEMIAGSRQKLSASDVPTAPELETIGKVESKPAPGPVAAGKEAATVSPDREATAGADRGATVEGTKPGVTTEDTERGATAIVTEPEVATEGLDRVDRDAYREALRELDAREAEGPARAIVMGAAPSAEKAKAGETGEIRGRITDAGGNPVAHAQIVVVGTRFGTMTDEDGFFVIRNILAGTYSLRVTATGYEELLVRNVVAEKGQTKDLPAVQLKEEGLKEAKDKIVGKGPGHILGKLFSRGKTRDDGRTQAVAPEMEVGHPDRYYTSRQALKRAPGYPSLTGGSRPVNDDLADDMFFRHYGTNPFVDAEEDALSTFGLDVDTGSYTISRRYIQEGHLPPTEAVRVEEFVNFFRKDFPPPRHDDLRVHIDGMPSPFAHVQDGSYWLLRVGIRGRVIDERDRLPAQIVLVIDTSGSMKAGNRLGLLKASMDVLLDELRPDDEIGLVEFKTRARVVLPLTPVSEGREIYRAIRSLRADGSTNAEHGLDLGYEMMRRAARKGRIHRVILCSDGVANEGSTGWRNILENVRRESDRISLTTIGFGMGNYNDILLEQLADAGDGQYAYVDDLREAIRVLRENFTGTMQTIARNAKAQIEFDPNYVDKYRLLGYENRDVRDQDFRRDDVDAGEIGAGHEVTVLYEVKLKPDLGRRRLATVNLRYEQPEGGRVVEIDEPVRAGDLRREVYDAPADLVVDACVAEFAEILRGSYWAKDGSLADVLGLLRDATARMTSQPEVDELMDLVERAIALQEQDFDEDAR